MVRPFKSQASSEDATPHATAIHMLGQLTINTHALAAGVLAALLTFSASKPSASANEIDSLYKNPRPFLAAIEKERPATNFKLDVSGITVPHHLLAADLIARAFWLSSETDPARVIILSPDHFNKSRRAFATTRANFNTPFGLVSSDVEAANTLLQKETLFDDSDLFLGEHGIGALVPFVKSFFPNAKILPIAVSSRSTRADWNDAIEAMRGLITDRTLIIQSTDYSHYLPLSIAVLRDQETLNVISAADVESLDRLIQPNHMDSKGSQYIQMQIQKEQMHAFQVVVGNRNSAEYGANKTSTTSYIATIYHREPIEGAKLHYDDQEIFYFAGDTLLGRWLTSPLLDENTSNGLIKTVLNLTGGKPLIVNLEGTLLEFLPSNLNERLHAMPAELAIRILGSLNVRAVSVANNHSRDFGEAAYRRSLALLRKASIIPLEHMRPRELRGIGLVAINFVSNTSGDKQVIQSNIELSKLCTLKARSPLIAFVHWGEEFRKVADDVQYKAADLLRSCGVGILIGAHSHQASRSIEARMGGDYQVTHSLGNFIFDQRSTRASGKLLEIRRFQQGTIATRLIDLPNLYDLAVPTKASGDALSR
jgi:poly-gamma-glutamate synthesis protein (capsule biosynthesis protein)